MEYFISVAMAKFVASAAHSFPLMRYKINIMVETAFAVFIPQDDPRLNVIMETVNGRVVDIKRILLRGKATITSYNVDRICNGRNTRLGKFPVTRLEL